MKELVTATTAPKRPSQASAPAISARSGESKGRHDFEGRAACSYERGGHSHSCLQRVHHMCQLQGFLPESGSSEGKHALVARNHTSIQICTAGGIKGSKHGMAGESMPEWPGTSQTKVSDLARQEASKASSMAWQEGACLRNVQKEYQT
eukprot:1138339-Pelagomonas_calceolata.AAC.5